MIRDICERVCSCQHMNSKIKDLSLIALQSGFNRSLSVSYSGLQIREVRYVRLFILCLCVTALHYETWLICTNKGKWWAHTLEALQNRTKKDICCSFIRLSPRECKDSRAYQLLYEIICLYA